MVGVGVGVGESFIVQGVRLSLELLRRSLQRDFRKIGFKLYCILSAWNKKTVGKHRT